MIEVVKHSNDASYYVVVAGEEVASYSNYFLAIKHAYELRVAMEEN